VDELNRLADAIERTVNGPVWHGSALGELLSGVSVEYALAHPIPGAHSVWELVHHISAWARIAEARLAVEPPPEPTDAEDWPPVTRPTPSGWKRALEQLTESHSSLAHAVRRCDPATLNRRMPGRKHSARTMLLGIPEHGAYHGGQIVLLTRALQNRP
jgi:uncharacterized damage-inducible protein DinB